MERVPDEINYLEIKSQLESMPGVSKVFIYLISIILCNKLKRFTIYIFGQFQLEEFMFLHILFLKIILGIFIFYCFLFVILTFY
jgi:hypothetical protein